MRTGRERDDALRQRPRDQGRLSLPAWSRLVRHGLLLGRGAPVLAAARRLFDGGRLCRRQRSPILTTGACAAAAPATPRSCSWSTTRRLSGTRAAARVLGIARSHAGQCARATTSARSTARPSSAPTPRNARPQRTACAATALRCSAAGRGPITTEIRDAPVFYYAEDYHQQYLAKNPDGYCGIGGCGVPFKLRSYKWVRRRDRRLNEVSQVEPEGYQLM